MKNALLIILLLIGSTFSLFPCTTFVIQKGNDFVFGRNLDWVSDNGIMVVNKRNVTKTSLAIGLDKPVSWTSKYGSITFNQFGKEFPFGGMNEKGLVIEIMLAPASYPLRDERPVVNELQWIQYQLDNAQNIDEIIASDKKLRISKVQQDLHFLISDGSGKVAVIEFVNHKMVVYRDANLPVRVLENDPYQNSLQKYKAGKTGRFTKAAKMIDQLKLKDNVNVVDYSFQILNGVALSGSWSVVYDIKNKVIHFKTASNKSVQLVNMSTFDFSCNGENLCYPLKNQNKGGITKKFVVLTDDLNESIMKDAFVKNSIQFPASIETRFLNYHKECKCK